MTDAKNVKTNQNIVISVGRSADKELAIKMQVRQISLDELNFGLADVRNVLE